MSSESAKSRTHDVGVLGRIGDFAQRRSGWVISGTLILTLLLFIPIIAMSPSERASDNAGGEVFDIAEEMEDKMPPSVHYMPYIVEARDGDVLTQTELWELYQSEEELRQSDIGRAYLYNRYDVDAGTVVPGVYTIADAVQSFFLAHPEFGATLENATDQQVKLAIHYVLANPTSSGMADWFSEDATRETKVVAGQPIDYWGSPGFISSILSDNEKVLGAYAETLPDGYADTLVKEHFDRDIQRIMRGDEEGYRLWGIAIDADLEGEEEGATSAPLVLGATIVILIVVSIHFRSLQANLLTLLGLGMLVVWMKGLSNLVGLNSSLTLDILLPIAILVLGVDYAIHSLHRYREGRESGDAPQAALRNGIVGVGGALVLAMLTTAAAFLSNTSSGIEEIIGFGIAGALGMFSALIIMGLFLPTLGMRLDVRRLRKQAEKDGQQEQTSTKGTPEATDRQRGRLLGRIVCALADRRAVVLPLALIITITAGYYASKLEAQLDVKEYFDSSSDFVVGLDKLDEHVGQKGGEPAIVYIKGRLDEPESLLAIRIMIDNMGDNEHIARDPNDGKPRVTADIFDFLTAVLESDVATTRIEASRPGVSITDVNEDGVPDTREQLRATYDYIVQSGIPLDEATLRYEPSRVRESLFHDPTGAEEDATLVTTGIPGTREQAVVKASKLELTQDMQALQVSTISFAGLTGSAYERDVTLEAITNSLNRSIIIAGALCLLIITIAFRSLRYGIVTVIPVVLVAAWLYAVMYLTGYHLNAVTATIAALSIGVGIDYSVHITVRFRQELRNATNKRAALERAASQSGSALLGSAASTTLGFLVLGFAPMPMFSAFGVLTALMIVMAFIAALVVLPSMLMLVAPKGSGDAVDDKVGRLE